MESAVHSPNQLVDADPTAAIDVETLAGPDDIRFQGDGNAAHELFDRNQVVAVTVADAGAREGVGVGDGGGLIVSVTVPSSESVDPSEAAKVKRSVPVKSASGKKVARFPSMPTLPCSGCETMRNDRASPSASLASSAALTVVLALVESAVLVTTGA